MDDNRKDSSQEIRENRKRGKSKLFVTPVISIAQLRDCALPECLYICQPLKRCHREVILNANKTMSRKDERVLILITSLTFLFIVAEIIGGYLAHSLAIMTDACHMISDLVSFVISILAIHLARKPATTKYSFGYQRAEVLGALSSVLIIWMLTLFLVYFAIERIIRGEYEVGVRIMIITSGIAVVFNLIIGALLHFSKSNHSHFGSSHLPEVSPTKNGDNIENGMGIAGNVHPEHKHENLNIRAAFIHVLGDLVQSIGVLIAALVINFTGFELADPICTFLFGVIVLMTTVPIMKDTIEVLMEAKPSHLNMSQVCSDLMLIPGVKGVHSLRIWALKLDSTAISVHLDTDIHANINLHAIMAEAHLKLQQDHEFDFITVQAQCHSIQSADGIE
ncbi:cation efflux family domain-containing protein [Ditylenchus destructor]|uniref:Cation efflux family domain-containing protein n=1 Tax=Ditylenchus destructor TaxID=166010 RepID=A0AAD4MSR2_9BILA|nr:cation efflux family domain-containing protein [Ditylenchus destructor]